MPPEKTVDQKTKKPLVERQYLGEGYIHRFINNETREIVNIPCTKEEYEALALPNPVNPTLAGHTWLVSAGGTVKVDTPDTTLGEGEYCVFGDRVVINESKQKDEYVIPVSELQNTLTSIEADLA